MLKMNFIGEWFLDDFSICDNLISYYQHCPEKNKVFVKDLKENMEIYLDTNTNNHIILQYLNQLQKICEKYIEKYSYCAYYDSWTITERFKIQHYNPNQGFYGYHTERTSSEIINSKRHLVFMTYLNDINNGGETEFFYQRKKIKPEKGKTLIWPADWTHTHRGIVSTTDEKYIITGWYSYK
jgi:prolyl 4-hydroxylase